MVRFLPSRLTLVRLAFFIALSGFTDLTTPGVFHYVIPMGSIIYFNKWERRRRNADRRGWWSSIKTSFIMPCIGANIASMIYGTIAGVFQGIAEPYSKADACYTFLDLPGVLRLADPNILWKNTVCDIVHDISRQDIAGTHGAFRYLYRTSGNYVDHIFSECINLRQGLAMASGDVCSINYFHELLDNNVASNELCLHITGLWNPELSREIAEQEEELAKDFEKYEREAMEGLDVYEIYAHLDALSKKQSPRSSETANFVTVTKIIPAIGNGTAGALIRPTGAVER